jgi:hypothetical protein
MKALALVVLLSLVSCTDNQATLLDASPCSEVSCPLHLPEAGSVEEVSDTIAQDNWQFAVSGPGWQVVDYPTDDHSIKIVMANEGLDTIIFLAKEPTQKSATDYIMSVMRTFRMAEATISSAKTIKINDTLFLQINAATEGKHLASWVSVKNGFGYVFTCSVDKDDVPIAGCEKIASTLVIQ